MLDIPLPPREGGDCTEDADTPDSWRPGEHGRVSLHFYVSGHQTQPQYRLSSEVQSQTGPHYKRDHYDNAVF